MPALRGTFALLWRIWFLVVILTAILLLFPFIFFTSLREKDYPRFFPFARFWAKWVLFFMGFRVKVKHRGIIDPNRQYIICANHTSNLDIMLTLALVPNCFVFIGKKELARIPLFGYFYRRTNILVDRSSFSSKKKVMDLASERLDKGLSLCIYPEGGIPHPKHHLAPFKMGAFKLALDHNIPILPLTFADNKRKFPDRVFRGYPGVLRATVHDVLEVDDLEMNDIHRLKETCYDVISRELINYGIHP